MPKRTNRKQTLLSIGVVSEGTLKIEDLVSALVNALDPIALSAEERGRVRSANFAFKREGFDWSGSDALDLLEDLTIAVEDHVPPFCRYGANEGDGALFQVVPDWGHIEEEVRTGAIFKGAEEPTAEDRRDHSFGWWLQVNDRGNATLYRWSGNGQWREVWSVV